MHELTIRKTKVLFVDSSERFLHSLARYGLQLGERRREKGEKVLFVVRCAPKMNTAGEHYVSRSASFKGDQFYVLAGVGKASIPFEGLLDTNPVEIVYEEKCDPIRLFGYVVAPILRVRAMLHGFLFTHAASAAIDGKGLLLPAWGNAGKTNILLTLSRWGASVMSDDWSIVGPGPVLIANPERRINLLSYNISALPELKRLVPLRKKCLCRVHRASNTTGLRNGGMTLLRLVESIGRLTDILSQHYVIGSRCPYRWAREANLCLILELTKAPTTCRVIRPVEASEVIQRCWECFRYENNVLFNHIIEYGYAFRRPSSTIIADVESLYRSQWRSALRTDRSITLGSLVVGDNCSASEFEHLSGVIRARLAEV